MKLKMLALIAVALLAGCGDEHHEDHRTKPDPVEELRKQMLQLQAELQSIVESDYATCGGALSPAAQNICKIAQAATIEVRVEMRGAIADMASQLESKINNGAADFTQMAAAWKQIYGSDFPSTSSPGVPTLSDCETNTGNASILGCISEFADDIDTLNSAISVLTGTVNGAMTTVEIGTENISAGPFYEQLLRLGDKLRINAYTDGLATAFTTPNNPIAASSGSATVTITTSSAHGMTAGDKVRIEDCQSGRGFTWQHLNGTFELASGSGSSFTIVMSTTAGSNGTLGGATCVIRKFSGAGVATVWTSADPSDSAVRKTTGGSKSYNFIIKKGLTGAGSASEGYACYDTTNRSATFATINAATAVGLTGNIRCK